MATNEKRAGLASGPLDDEVYTPSSRRSEGRGSYLEDAVHYCLASKTSLPTITEQRKQIQPGRAAIPAWALTVSFRTVFTIPNNFWDE